MMLVRYSMMSHAARSVREFRKHMQRLIPVVAFVRESIDLLDVVLLSALTLITIGTMILWGGGAACLVLGSLLLGMIVFGIPVARKEG